MSKRSLIKNLQAWSRPEFVSLLFSPVTFFVYEFLWVCLRVCFHFSSKLLAKANWSFILLFFQKNGALWLSRNISIEWCFSSLWQHTQINPDFIQIYFWQIIWSGWECPMISINRSRHHMCSVKKVFWEILQNSQKNTYADSSFLIKLHA